MLRKGFYLVLILTGVTVLTALSTGFVLFHRLVYILGLTTVLSFAWSWVSLKTLEVSVDRRSGKVRVGDNVEGRITVRYTSALPKPVLEVEDLTDLPGYSSGMAVVPRPKGLHSWRTVTRTRMRGVYTMGPVRVSSSDIFGMFRWSKLFGGTDSLLVYPKTFDLPHFTIPAAHLSGEVASRKRSHDLTPYAASVREYSVGDSISRIHWNSTARMGRLMSKQFDTGVSSDVWLFIDLFRDVQAGELEESTDEYAVSIAASLAEKYLKLQLPLGAVAYGDQRYFLSADTGAGQYDRVIEALAMSKAEGTVPLESALASEEALWAYPSSLVVMTSSHRPQWVTALREIAKRRVRVAVVLIDGRSFGGIFNTLDVVPALYEAGLPPFVVRKGDDVPMALGSPYATGDIDAPGRPQAVETGQ